MGVSDDMWVIWMGHGEACWAAGWRRESDTLQYVLVLIKARYPCDTNQIYKFAFPNE